MMLIDGRVQDRLSARDRGLHFGDGVFETLSVDAGRALCLERHLVRLDAGCARLRIPAPERVMLQEECARVCDGVERAVLKIIVTRGVGGRGYRADPNGVPTRIVARYPWPRYPAHARTDGVAVGICSTRLGRNPRLAGVKHLNRLEQVLARSEDALGACPEGLMLDDRGRLIEGIMSNVFVRRGERLSTPDLSECGVAGIMRELVLEVSERTCGLVPEIVALGVEDLTTAEECFLTNSLIGIWPIKSVAGQALRTGPAAHQLQELLTERGAIASDGP